LGLAAELFGGYPGVLAEGRDENAVTGISGIHGNLLHRQDSLAQQPLRPFHAHQHDLAMQAVSSPR